MLYEELQQAAFALYDGGWRGEDKDWLVDEYEFTEDEVDIVCQVLTDIEAGDYK